MKDEGFKPEAAIIPGSEEAMSIVSLLDELRSHIAEQYTIGNIPRRDFLESDLEIIPLIIRLEG